MMCMSFKEVSLKIRVSVEHWSEMLTWSQGWLAYVLRHVEASCRIGSWIFVCLSVKLDFHCFCAGEVKRTDSSNQQTEIEKCRGESWWKVENEGRYQRIPSMISHFYQKDMVSQKNWQKHQNLQEAPKLYYLSWDGRMLQGFLDNCW